MDSSISHSPSHKQCSQNPSSSLPFPLSNRVQPPTITTRFGPGDRYQTTFVQTDLTSFKQVVQMLTGPSKPANPSITQTFSIPPVKSIVPKKHHHHHHHQYQHQHQHSSAIKLYERRNSMNRSLNINNLVKSTRQPEITSLSVHDLHSLTLPSPVTPLLPDPFDRSGPSESYVRLCLDMEAEEKAIKEKGFFLHPSPISTPRNTKPRLLPLFPISPKDSSR